MEHICSILSILAACCKVPVLLFRLNILHLWMCFCPTAPGFQTHPVIHALTSWPAFESKVTWGTEVPELDTIFLSLDFERALDLPIHCQFQSSPPTPFGQIVRLLLNRLLCCVGHVCHWRFLLLSDYNFSRHSAPTWWSDVATSTTSPERSVVFTSIFPLQANRLSFNQRLTDHNLRCIYFKISRHYKGVLDVNINAVYLSVRHVFWSPSETKDPHKYQYGSSQF